MASEVRSKWSRLVTFAVVLGLGCFSAAVQSWAQGIGDLMVTPARVVFSGSTRTFNVNVVHRGLQPARYRISLENKRMTENGSLEPILVADPNNLFAEELIRYSPRQVLIQPGESQTIRLLLRRSGDLAPGEYRSHLLVRALPPEDAGTDIEATELGEGEVRVQLIPIYGITIPIIVRHGELTASASLSSLELERNDSQDGPVLALQMNRAGDRSLYGDFTVYFSPADGGQIEVGRVGGVAAYTSVSRRAVRIQLFPPEGLDLRGGTLSVKFDERPEFGGDLSAEAELRLP